MPQRRIALTNGDHLDVYDTSGPYTDPSADIAVERGLPPTRDSWHRPEPAPADPAPVPPGWHPPSWLGHGRKSSPTKCVSSPPVRVSIPRSSARRWPRAVP